MNRITIELWLGISEEFKGDFQPLSEIRTGRVEEVEDETTIWQLLEYLARSNVHFARKIFDRDTKSLYPNLVLNYNDQVISFHEAYDKILKHGDKITILPMYAGG
jgi:molybdopterin converting factor small subunit